MIRRRTNPLRRALVLAGVAVASVAAAPAAWAQSASSVTVDAAALVLEVEVGEVAERTVTISNAGAEAAAFCLDFDDPLATGAPTAEARAWRTSRLTEAGCEAPGALVDSVELGGGNRGRVTMTPEGRLFNTGSSTAQEFTPDLELVHEFYFDNPSGLYGENGLAYMPDPAGGEGTLWWNLVPSAGFVVLHENDLDGHATGRRVRFHREIPPDTVGGSAGLAFDPNAGDDGLFFYVDEIHDTIVARDLDGAVAEGYPVAKTSYTDSSATGITGTEIDAHGAPESRGGGRFEVGVGLPGEGGTVRIVVTDRLGCDTGAETPVLPTLDDVLSIFSLVRSRVDPNGALYVTVSRGNWPPIPDGNFTKWIYAMRPAPLAPVWTSVSEWGAALAPGASHGVTFTFDAAALKPGVYADTLRVEAGTPGAAEHIAVPVQLTVVPQVSNEDGASAPAAFTLGPAYPNPARDEVAVPFALPEAADVRLAVYDVLGRQVAVLTDERREAGRHAARFETGHLASGVYLVQARLTVASHAPLVLTQKLIVLP